jgi:hypothetical protein
MGACSFEEVDLLLKEARMAAALLADKSIEVLGDEFSLSQLELRPDCTNKVALGTGGGGSSGPLSNKDRGSPKRGFLGGLLLERVGDSPPSPAWAAVVVVAASFSSAVALLLVLPL